MRTIQHKRAWDLIGGLALLVLVMGLAVGCGGSTTTTTTAATAAATTATTGGTETTAATTATTSGELPVVRMQGLSGGIGPLILKAIETAKLDEKHGFKGEYAYIDADASTQFFLLKKTDVSFDSDVVAVAIARNAGHMVTNFDAGITHTSSIVVRKDSPYQSPKDLIGKTVGHIGADSGATTTMTVLLKQLYNIDINKDYKLIMAGSPALIDLLEKGEIDGIFIATPFLEKVVATGNGRIIFTPALSGVYAPPSVCLAAYEDWLKSHKQLAYAVRAAVEDARKMFVDSNYKLFLEEPYRTLLNVPDPKVLDAIVARAAKDNPLMSIAWTKDSVAQADKFLQYMADNKVILEKMPPAGGNVLLEDLLGPEGQ